MRTENVYTKLAEHLSYLGMGYPFREELVAILKENFSPQEAEVALAIPTKPIPLQPVEVDEIQKGVDLPREELVGILESLSQRGLLFSARTDQGGKGYAIQQVGFGFPQTFFWKNEDTPHARKMAAMTAKYFNRTVTQEAFSGSATKPYRYIPVGRTIPTTKQAIFPFEMMESVIGKAR
jgi:hypothetical protein